MTSPFPVGAIAGQDVQSLRMAPEEPHHRFHRSIWSIVVYLLAFAILITVIARWYLAPAVDAATQATPGQRQHLSAYSLLLLAITLMIVLVGIVLTFRISRFFFPRPPAQRTPTKYIDAWAESGKRLNEKFEDADS